jgi:hypothetical protein
MPCCASRPERRSIDGARRAVLCALLGLWVCTSWGWAAAPTAPELRREADGLYLSARLPLELPAGLQEVLLRGVPVHFVWQAEVRRSRWYWKDQRLASEQRLVRVAYQPLTRRWRVSVGTPLPTGPALSGALHQNLDTYEQAMAVVLSVSRWRLLAADEGAEGADLKVDLQLRLDGGFLSRPFPLAAAGPLEGGMLYRITLDVPAGVEAPQDGP